MFEFFLIRPYKKNSCSIPYGAPDTRWIDYQHERSHATGANVHLPLADRSHVHHERRQSRRAAHHHRAARAVHAKARQRTSDQSLETGVFP